MCKKISPKKQSVENKITTAPQQVDDMPTVIVDDSVIYYSGSLVKKNLEDAGKCNDQQLIEFQKRAEGRCKGQYDGLNGLPPDWVSERDHKAFLAARDRLIEDCDYESERLISWIQHEDVSGNTFLRNIPSSMPRDHFMDLDRLRLIFKAVQIGEEEGSRMLGGEHAAANMKRLKRLKIAGQLGADTNRKKSGHERWKEESRKIREGSKKRLSKLDVARSVKKRLHLSQGVGHISKFV